MLYLSCCRSMLTLLAPVTLCFSPAVMSGKTDVIKSDKEISITHEIEIPMVKKLGEYVERIDSRNKKTYAVLDNGIVYIKDSTTDHTIKSIKLPRYSNSINACGWFSDDNKRFLVTTTLSVDIYDIESGQQLASTSVWNDDIIVAINDSKNERLFVIDAGGMAVVIEIGTGVTPFLTPVATRHFDCIPSIRQIRDVALIDTGSSHWQVDLAADTPIFTEANLMVLENG